MTTLVIGERGRDCTRRSLRVMKYQRQVILWRSANPDLVCQLMLRRGQDNTKIWVPQGGSQIRRRISDLRCQISKNVIPNNLRSDICNLKCAKRSVFGVFVAIEVQHSRLFVNYGLEVYGPAPEGVHMFKCFAGVSHLEFSALVAVLQVKFAVAVVISVLNFKVGKSKVSHV